MKVKILYILMLLITFFYGMLYYVPALIGLGIVEIMILVFFFIILQITCKKIVLEIYLPISVAEKNQRVSVGIKVKNRSIFPITRIQAKMVCRNRFYQENMVHWISGMAAAREETRIVTGMKSDRCGLAELKIQDVWVYDMIGIFRKKIKIQMQESVAIMPEFYEISLTLENDMDKSFTECDKYDPYKPGDDPGEIFQIREYQGGDRLQSIHWKLSARTEKLMVKEYSDPLVSGVAFFLDMEYEYEKGYDLLDEFIEAAVAISNSLVENDIDHFIIWFDKDKKDIERMKVHEKDDLYLVLERLFEAGPYHVPVPLRELYTERYREEGSNTQILLNLKMELWKNNDFKINLCGKARELLQEGELII